MSSNSSFQGSANFANNAYDYLTDYNPTDDNIPSSNNIPVTFEGALVNESPGGYCISWEGNIPSSLHTGEIIALEHKQEQCEPYWVVGAIRWIKEISLDKAHIGVQFLGPCTKAARAFIAENHTEDLGVRALLLPALTSYGRPQTLITPPLPFKEGTNVSVVIDGKTYLVFLKTILERSNSFSQFHVQFKDNDKKEPSRDLTPNFDEIWSTL